MIHAQRPDAFQRDLLAERLDSVDGTATRSRTGRPEPAQRGEHRRRREAIDDVDAPARAAGTLPAELRPRTGPAGPPPVERLRRSRGG